MYLVSCIVRVEGIAERKKLVEWLKGIGGRYRGCESVKKNHIVVDGFRKTVTSWNLNQSEIEQFKEAGYIICGTNIALFKALVVSSESD